MMINIKTYAFAILIVFSSFYHEINCGDNPLEDIDFSGSVDEVAQRIFGGQDVSVSEYLTRFQWIGEILLKNDKTCIGALIHPQFFMTSSYCLEPTDSNIFVEFDIVFHRMKNNNVNSEVGETRLEGLTIFNVIYNDDYSLNDPNHRNDIALVYFPDASILQDLNGKQVVPSMPFVSPGTKVDPQKCYISGWFVVNLSKLYPDILQYLQIPFLCKEADFLQCVAAWATRKPSIIVDPNTMLCAGFYNTPYKGPCNGERGTPLICDDSNGDPTAIGILINANDCNNQDPKNNIPAVFLNIYTYLPFIEDAMRSKLDLEDDEPVVDENGRVIFPPLTS